ncbi:MAG TPA: ribosome biogenesis factor YjgA [Usitatibacter sp.]|nr:ribosome biogenesis factor YjgA [Usitatibacter sp.]
MEEDDFISKTRRKREAHDLQDLGKALVKLSREQLARIDMPENLREAVNECRRFTKHEAIRRQMQYIGRLMRVIDASPIAAQLAELEAPSKRQTALFHVAEQWRTEIVANPESIARLQQEYPDIDAKRLLDLAERAREEKRTSKPPRRYRELFHVLNSMLQEHGRRQS